METKEYKTYNGNLYTYSAGVYCGVLMKESSMKRLAKIQAKYLEDVKNILADENDKGNIFPYMWTLHYPDGKQTYVTYIDTNSNVETSIKNATTLTDKPRHVPVCFIASSMDEAKKMANARHAELTQTEPKL